MRSWQNIENNVEGDARILAADFFYLQKRPVAFVGNSVVLPNYVFRISFETYRVVFNERSEGGDYGALGASFSKPT